MNPQKQKPISQLIANSELANLTQQVTRLHAIQAQLQTILPPEFKDQCQAVAFKNQCLILTVPNGSLATKLGFYIPQLLSQLRQQPEFMGIASIKHRVQPTSIKTETKPKKSLKRRFTQASADTLVHVADKIEYDPLKEAMLRLAQNICQR